MHSPGALLQGPLLPLPAAKPGNMALQWACRLEGGSPVKVRSPGTRAVWDLGQAMPLKSQKGPGGTGVPPSLAALERTHIGAGPPWRTDTPFQGGPEAVRPWSKPRLPLLHCLLTAWGLTWSWGSP